MVELHYDHKDLLDMNSYISLLVDKPQVNLAVPENSTQSKSHKVWCFMCKTIGHESGGCCLDKSFSLKFLHVQLPIDLSENLISGRADLIWFPLFYLVAEGMLPPFYLIVKGRTIQNCTELHIFTCAY